MKHVIESGYIRNYKTYCKVSKDVSMRSANFIIIYVCFYIQTNYHHFYKDFKLSH